MIFDCHSTLTVNEGFEHNCLVTSQQTYVGLEGISWRRLQDVSEANKSFTGDMCI